MTYYIATKFGTRIDRYDDLESAEAFVSRYNSCGGAQVHVETDEPKRLVTRLAMSQWSYTANGYTTKKYGKRDEYLDIR